MWQLLFLFCLHTENQRPSDKCLQYWFAYQEIHVLSYLAINCHKFNRIITIVLLLSIFLIEYWMYSWVQYTQYSKTVQWFVHGYYLLRQKNCNTFFFFFFYFFFDSHNNLQNYDNFVKTKCYKIIHIVSSGLSSFNVLLNHLNFMKLINWLATTLPQWLNGCSKLLSWNFSMITKSLFSFDFFYQKRVWYDCSVTNNFIVIVTAMIIYKPSQYNLYR